MKRFQRRLFVPVLLFTFFGLVCSACRANQAAAPASNKPLRQVTVTLQSIPLAPAAACSDRFLTHKLPFSTGARLREISTYISNGSGVAVNDLDNDGDLDLVFASVDSESAILWNQGDLTLREERLDDKFTRGVATVDVDGDGWLDIVFTHRGLEPPSYWHNLGARFVRSSLPGVEYYAYAMGWADLNGDGALDLVTSSYGAELKQHGIAEPGKHEQAGVVLYYQSTGRFMPYVLDNRSEALSVALVDLNQDGRSDIWVANDFALQDLVWLNNGDRWQPAQPFGETSHSTMSIDWGDLDNDGRLALFTTDMNPYDISPTSMAEWLPMMNQMGEHRAAGDPQVMANVLQMVNWRGRWSDQANRRGVAASGWSWAGRFGDLDNDGWLDLYVVNGMIAADMFGHLPNGELVEENQAFRNDGRGQFDPAPQWRLGSTASGRGMVMADLDGDGDLDIAVNNLRGLAELHENQLCGGSALMVDLRWPASHNPYAVGARVRLLTTQGSLQRDVRSSGGYLSGESARLHFGLPPGANIAAIEIIWPDGAHSTVQNVTGNSRLKITRNDDP